MKRWIVPALAAAVAFFAAFVLVVDLIGGCYPWAACASHSHHRAGPE